MTSGIMKVREEQVSDYMYCNHIGNSNDNELDSRIN